MTQETKPSKWSEIKEIASSGAEIIKQIRTPGVQDSVGKVMDTTLVVKDIIEQLKTPEMIKNIENFKTISENMNNASTKIKDAIQCLEENGILGDAKDLIISAKNTTNLIHDKHQELADISNTVKETVNSIKTLVKVLKIITIS